MRWSRRCVVVVVESLHEELSGDEAVHFGERHIMRDDGSGGGSAGGSGGGHGKLSGFRETEF